MYYLRGMVPLPLALLTYGQMKVLSHDIYSFNILDCLLCRDEVFDNLLLTQLQVKVTSQKR